MADPTGLFLGRGLHRAPLQERGLESFRERLQRERDAGAELLLGGVPR